VLQCDAVCCSVLQCVAVSLHDRKLTRHNPLTHSSLSPSFSLPPSLFLSPLSLSPPSLPLFLSDASSDDGQVTVSLDGRKLTKRDYKTLLRKQRTMQRTKQVCDICHLDVCHDSLTTDEMSLYEALPQTAQCAAH